MQDERARQTRPDIGEPGSRFRVDRPEDAILQTLPRPTRRPVVRQDELHQGTADAITIPSMPAMHEVRTLHRQTGTKDERWTTNA
jgi:hypothetical protein